MDNNFYNDHFEQFLKETVDDFRMYPSKRVWNSLYNNLHPGRKWPSVATCLLIMFTISLFGVTNKNVVIRAGNIANNQGDLIALNTTIDKDGISPEITTALTSGKVLFTNAHIPTVNLNQIVTSTAAHSNSRRNHSSRNINSIASNDLKQANANTGNNNDNITITEHFENISPVTELTEIGNTNTHNNFTAENKAAVLTAQLNEYNLLTASLKEPSVKRPLVRKRGISIADREWIEDFAFHNKPKSKWNGRLSHEWYITPSIGYRSMTKNVNTDEATAAFATPSSNRGQSFTFSHAPSWNLEIGNAFLLSVSKSIRLKAGVQLNYTRYKVTGVEMDHPGYTTILLKNSSTGEPEFVSRSSSIANVPVGSKGSKLNSSTYQISVPLGAEIKLAGSSRLKWFAGATIQPTYVLGGNPYLISADMKNYVYDVSLLRRLNFNASFETFVSFDLKNNMALNAGPQFRYQLLSTYNRRYVYDEKLYNIGLKVGVTRNF